MRWSLDGSGLAVCVGWIEGSTEMSKWRVRRKTSSDMQQSKWKRGLELRDLSICSETGRSR